jgi:hypothetical protein
VYDMYHWDQPDQAALNGAQRPSRPVRGTRHSRRPVHGARPGPPAPGGRDTGAACAAGPAAQAVQVALDRRDNGGDSSARRDQ